jgi:hypothetical protein
MNSCEPYPNLFTVTDSASKSPFPNTPIRYLPVKPLVFHKTMNTFSYLFSLLSHKYPFKLEQNHYHKISVLMRAKIKHKVLQDLRKWQCVLLHMWVRLCEGKWSEIRPGRFTPSGRSLWAHWIEICVIPRDGLDDEKKKQDRQCTYNVTLRRVRVTIVVEKQEVLHILSVCL